jgi:hypothetical protein
VQQQNLFITKPTEPPGIRFPFTMPPTQEHRFPTGTRKAPVTTEVASKSESEAATKALLPESERWAQMSGAILVGVLVGALFGVVTMGVVIWFWWYYTRKLDRTDDQYSSVMTEVTVRDDPPNMVRNPIFSGACADQNIDPFYDDFATSTEDVEFV